MKWTKPEEGLPEEKQLILFVADIKSPEWPREKCLGIYNTDTLFKSAKSHPFKSFSGFSYNVKEILYWMPYPELPKEDG